ncbi:MAG: hypothetical protein RMK50_02060 [Nitrososphaerota archaeon]|nr:hypothetical protein [Candidatus Bathyarchaeota archaeon]MDW8193597.1 hypothetical protein [Nitrososphaerota archaeon]
MSLSPINEAMRRTCNVLRHEASMQVIEYEKRFSHLRNFYDKLLSNLVKMSFNFNEVYKTAEEFFGDTAVRFAGIDGTMYSRPLFDMVVFFGGAYAATGTVSFQENDKPAVSYDERLGRNAAGISSVIPIYVNEVPDVDQAFFDVSQPGEVNLAKPLTEESIINNATVANRIMTLAEYYLAYRFAVDSDSNIHIIIMDRSLSVERASLLYDTSKRALWDVKCNLIGYQVDDEPIDANDLNIGRQLVSNVALGLPPPRADYLRHAIIDLLKRQGALTERQILSGLGIADEKRAERVKRSLSALLKKGILVEKNEFYILKPKYVNTWERLKKAVTKICERLFASNTPESTSLMKIMKHGREYWLTTIDMAFLTLFTLQMLVEECWKRRILLIGVTKDTAARDFKRQLIPIMHNEGLLEAKISREELDEIPNTDRMILQSASILNMEKITPPWSLIEYDSAFRTMMLDKKGRRGYVSGAIRNKIGMERLFLKTYIQLSQAKTDPMLRSNVLLVDRLVYPEYDYRPDTVVEFWNELSDETKEPVEAVLFINKDVPNRLQDLVMAILVAMTPSNIPEAFGHNTPLFIADKIAKWNYSQFKRIVDTTAEWILNNHKLRRFVFYMSTFRERRATIEAARREQI